MEIIDRLTDAERAIMHQTRFLDGMIGLASWLHWNFPHIPYNEGSALISRFKYATANPDYEVKLDDLTHIPYDDVLKLRDIFEGAMELRPEQKVWYKIITNDGKKMLKTMTLSKITVEVITERHPKHNDYIKQYHNKRGNNPPAPYGGSPGKVDPF